MKDFHKDTPGSILSKNRSDLGAVTIGAELTRLGANSFDAKVQGHFLRVVDMATCVARTWHELGAVDLGAVDLGTKLGAIFSGVDLGAAFSSANLLDMAGPNVHVSGVLLYP